VTPRFLKTSALLIQGIKICCPSEINLEVKELHHVNVSRGIWSTC